MRHGSEFKARVALEAIKGEKTLHELSVEYGVASESNKPVEEGSGGEHCKSIRT